MISLRNVLVLLSTIEKMVTSALLYYYVFFVVILLQNNNKKVLQFTIECCMAILSVDQPAYIHFNRIALIVLGKFDGLKQGLRIRVRPSRKIRIRHQPSRKTDPDSAFEKQL